MGNSNSAEASKTLRSAINSNDSNQVKNAIKSGINPDICIGDIRALQYAIKERKSDAAIALVEAGAQTTTEYEYIDETMFYHALEKGLENVCIAIVKKEKEKRGFVNKYYLENVIGKRRYKVLRFFLNEVSGVNTTIDGYNLMHYAVMLNDANLTEILLEYGYIQQKFTLHFATKKNAYNVVKALLKHDKSNINEADNLGITPLQWAITHGHDVIPILIEHGADINMNSPIFTAMYQNNLKAVDTLLALTVNLSRYRNEYYSLNKYFTYGPNLAETIVIKHLKLEDAKNKSPNAYINYLYTRLYNYEKKTT